MLNLNSGSVVAMQPITLASAGLKERQDLQQWVTEHPEMIAPDLLLVTTEFDRWAIRDRKVADRLDALFLDATGSPLVAELKRDRAEDTVELQALKYAAYCAQLTLDELAEEYAAYHDVAADEARQALLDHAPMVGEAGLQAIKIRLVAGEFGPSVTSVVLWLRDYGVDIGCVEVAVRQVPGASEAVISSRQLLPLPEAEDYLVRRRKKELEEDQARQGPLEGTWDSYAQQLPAGQLAIARRLYDQIADYVTHHELPWTPALRSWYLGYKRPGGYYVAVIHPHSTKPIGFAVKMPGDPGQIPEANPYPNLAASWNDHAREWEWHVPTIEDVPDVGLALDISRNYLPVSGPTPMNPAKPTDTRSAHPRADAT
jgi:hypothetical protein